MPESKPLQNVIFLVEDQIYRPDISGLDGYIHLNKGDMTRLVVGEGVSILVSVDYRIYEPNTDTGSHWDILFVCSQVAAPNSKIPELLKKKKQ